MYNSALEQFEILPFLSFALPKIDHTSLFSQAFDLPNSLLPFIFVIFFGIYKSLHLEASAIPIPAHVGKKVEELELEIEELIEKIINSSAGSKEISRLLEVIQELLRLQDKYKIISPEMVDNLRALLDSFGLKLKKTSK